MKMKRDTVKKRLAALEKLFASKEGDEDWMEAEGMNYGGEMISLRSALKSSKEDPVEVLGAR